MIDIAWAKIYDDISTVHKVVQMASSCFGLREVMLREQLLLIFYILMYIFGRRDVERLAVWRLSPSPNLRPLIRIFSAKHLRLALHTREWSLLLLAFLVGPAPPIPGFWLLEALAA